jgi:hypothetical protein
MKHPARSLPCWRHPARPAAPLPNRVAVGAAIGGRPALPAATPWHLAAAGVGGASQQGIK